MNDFTEKRDFFRMVVEGDVRYRIEGESQVSSGTVKNLSNSGLLMASDKEISLGTKLTIAIVPGHAITPPLLAEAKVIRCDSSDSDQFNIACTLERILAESEAGPDFP
ncbi:MAG: PilZ domain-containing protein [Candidatus Thiodiazotropha sp.]|jgi:hypothetical protein